MSIIAQHPFIVAAYAYLALALTSLVYTLYCVRMQNTRDWFTAIVFTGLLWWVWLAYVVAYYIKHRND